MTTAEQLPPLPSILDIHSNTRNAARTYALAAIAQIAAENEMLRDALQKIINMNIQYCKDKYGDASRAESMGCVSTARAAMKEQTP